MSGEGVNPTQVPSDDILLRLLSATEEIRDLLRQKADQENAQKLHEAQQSDDATPEADATQKPLNADMANVQPHNRYGWPNDETIARYKDRCARHKSECEKMQVELGCFIAHLGIVGGDGDVIRYAEDLRNGLLGPVACLEKALGVTPYERGNVTFEVSDSFGSLWTLIINFARNPHYEDAPPPNEVEKWRRIAGNGYDKMLDLVRKGKFVKCLEFIHDEFFIDLETAMSSIIEALTASEEKSASELLAAQTIDDFERRFNDYISRTPMDEIREPGTWPEPDTIRKFGKRLAEHKRLSNNMQVELDHLISHYAIIGGNKTVIDASTSVKQAMLSYIQYLESVAHKQPKYFRTEMCDVVKKLLIAVIRFQSSLYHQKHAFYFRNVKQWVGCTWIGALRILSLLHRGEMSKCIAYIHYTFLSDLERAMIGIAHGDQAKPGESSTNAVPEELKTFGKESLPKFLVDQMERDTTRYINLTTIATFFSSVTATTLQFTYAPLPSEVSDSLRGVVNLFWFLSLVFSVSSGVSSLLGLTWRKSSIYDSHHPPWFIRMWFDKAPMLFLIISAVAFVIGLNLFAYLSLQPRFVSLATNILTGLHGMGLLVVTLWFIYQLKHDSVWAGWIRTIMKSINAIVNWIIVTVMEWIWILMKWIGILIWLIVIGLLCITITPVCIFIIGLAFSGMGKWSLHLQRNIFWAFGINNRVARLNDDIFRLDWEHDSPGDWPGPYLLSKIVRLIAYQFKMSWLVANTESDVELGEIRRPRTAKQKKDEFRRSLQKIFSEARWVDSVMDDVEEWGRDFSEEGAERRIGRKLWGYPDLVEEFYDRVRPALVEARDEREERERREGMATRHVGGNRSALAPAVFDQEEVDTAFIPPQTSQTVRFADGSGPSDLRKTGDRQDNPTQQDDRPLPPDEPSLSTASTSAKGLEPTSGDPDSPLEVPGIGEGSILFNEIVEVASTSEYEDDRSRAAQRKGKARE